MESQNLFVGQKKDGSKKVANFYEKDQEYAEFSNFHPAPVEIKGKIWPTTEHYFQAMKYEGTEIEEKIRTASSTRKAFQLGRTRYDKIKLREDWEQVKLGIMYEAIKAKFTQHQELQKVLLGTGNAIIVEHTERDNFWGDGGDGSGRNELGKLLMQLRQELLEIGNKE